jgi:hypothetical protein
MAAAQEPEIKPQWKSFHAKRTGLITVSQYCPERPYVELQVPQDVHLVHRIVFKTISHDQGSQPITYLLKLRLTWPRFQRRRTEYRHL